MTPTSLDHKLKIKLLGGFEVSLDGRSLDGFAYSKMRALLAYLAVEREQDHSRDVLAELLWSAYEPVAARDNLRRTLSNLRRALELPSDITLFSTAKHTIRFIPDAYIDVMDLTGRVPRLPGNQVSDYSNEERKVDLYQGEFLAGLSLPDCPEFEDWLQIQRDTLCRRVLALLEQLSNYHTQIGRYSKALKFDIRYIELEPWNEDAHRRAILLYALTGQSRAAIGQYEICCRLLKKELGALAGEETKNLVERIRNGDFSKEPSAVIASPSSSNSISPLPSERRQTTVLYCELTLTAVSDPDEAMELLTLLNARCIEIIKRFSGHIVQTHGGGLLAYFGYPQAREDAARRAVQAALAVTRETAHNIKIRAAIHTGLIITSGEPLLLDTVGKVSKFAIRLRKSASYGKVAISQQTHNLVAGYFDCISLGVQSMPDIAAPLEIFQVVKESGACCRLDATAQFTPFAGREAEIAQLMALWEKAAQGVRQVALIQAEAGLGKSRLLLTIKQRLSGRPHTIRDLRCFPEFNQSPFYPLIAMFEAIIGIDHNDTSAMKFAKVVTYVKTHHPESQHDAVSMLTQLLSLDIDVPQPSHLSPQKQKELICTILLATLEALSLQQPVLLLVEDVHWIDSSTLEFLNLLVEKQQGGAIFAAFTTRPGFVPPWPEGFTIKLTLAPLSEAAVIEMVASISRDIPPETLRRIVERADGVPLFVEELAKMAMLDNWASIPATLQDLLVARMDMLGEAKLAAQSAATIGREFDLALLRNIYPHGATALEQDLDALETAGLIMKVNESTSQFKHALIQEAAYQSQTKTDRKSAHQRIAQALQSDFNDIVVNQPELLAQHLSAGGEPWLAIEYWLKAGQRASLKSANQEATEHFNSGLQLLMTLPSGHDRDRMEFSILLCLCPVLYAIQGYGSEVASLTNARISELSKSVEESEELFQAKWALVMNTIAGIGCREAKAAAAQLLSIAHEDPLRKQAAYYAMADAAFWLGEFEFTRIYTEQAIALYQPDQHKMLLERYNENLSVSCLAYLSWALYFLGDQSQAQQICNTMLTRARKLDHPHTLALALCFASVLHRWLNKRADTLSLAAETISISQQHGFPVWLAAGEMTHGWALVMQGQTEGISELKESITKMRAAIGGISVVFLSALIEAYVHLELPDLALELIAEAQANEISTGDGHFSAELYRLKGECLRLLSPSDTAQIESCFDQALFISRVQQAKSLEFRAAISMEKLWRHQGNQEAAQRLLDEVCRGFTETSNIPGFQQTIDVTLKR